MAIWIKKVNVNVRVRIPIHITKFVGYHVILTRRQTVDSVNKIINFIPPAGVGVGGWAVKLKIPIAAIIFLIVVYFVWVQITITIVGSGRYIICQTI